MSTLAKWLRRLADRIDREHAFVSTSLKLRYVEREGAVVDFDGPGITLWKRNNEDAPWLSSASG